MTPLDRMLAEHDIARLTTRFALLNDAGDWDAVAQTFTEDARFVRPAGGDPVMGRKAIHESFASRPARKSCHLITNIVVDVISADEATSRCTLLLYAAPPEIPWRPRPASSAAFATGSCARPRAGASPNGSASLI